VGSMSKGNARSRAASCRRGGRLFIAVALAVLAVQLLPEVQISDFADADVLTAFAAPALSPLTSSDLSQQMQSQQFVSGARGFLSKAGAEEHIARC